MSVVSGVYSSSGPPSGGGMVRIDGGDFTRVSAVHFGDTVAVNYSILSDTVIEAQAPGHAAGVVDVTVTSPDGVSSTSSADQYLYLTPSGPTGGGEPTESTSVAAAAPAVTGPTGPIAPTGPGGPTGFTAPTGPTGLIAAGGPTGFTAPTGPSGPTGMIAPSGPTAFIALGGPTGFTGPSGPSGPMGFIAPSGPTGYIAPSGPTGYIAPSGPTGYIAPTGFTAPGGPTGYIAPSGPSGFIAPTGPTGYIAPSGPSGFIAPTGPTGYIAPSGPTGYIAPSGFTAPSGPTGYIAPTGPTGYIAPTGPTGFTAPTGPTGFTAPTGPTGAIAPTGFTGPTGSIAPTGPTGFTAPSGSAGFAAQTAAVAAAPTGPAATPAQPALPQTIADAAAAGATVTFPRTTALFPPPATNPTAANPNPPAPSFVFSSYVKHYTGSGSGPSGAFYEDVTISETYGPTATSTTPVDQGTVTYTGWLLDYGEYVFNDTNVVTPIAPADVNSILTMGGGMTGGDVAAMNALSDLPFNMESWAHEHWTESIVRTSTGSFTGADGAAYLVSNLSIQNDTRDVTRTFDVSDELTPEVASVTTSYEGTLITDNVTSNLAANLPSGAGFDADGYPNDLLNAPVAGTTYLVRSFNSESWNGTEGVTNPYALDATTNYTRDSSYSGVDAYRDFEDLTSRIGAVGGPATDVLTRQVNYEREGTYEGGQSYDLSQVGLLLGANYSGTRSADRQDGGTVLVNTSDVKDAYYRDSGTLGAVGVFEVNTTDDGLPSTYSDSESSDQAYDANGHATTDTLSYDHERSADASTTVSNSYYYVAADRNAGGLLVGTTAGTSFVSATSDLHAEGSDVGVLDRLHGGGSVDVSGSYNGTDSSLKSWNAAYVGTDGSTPYNANSLVWTTDAVSGGSTRQGDYNAAGKQTDGTSTSHTESLGEGGGHAHSVNSGAAIPTKTTDVTSRGDSSADSSTNLTYNSDGTANGTVTAGADSYDREESTVTATGAYFIPGAMCSANGWCPWSIAKMT